MDRKSLARSALRAALELRLKAGIHRTHPVCVYDLAEKLGIEVRFCAQSSFEGLFSKNPSVVLVPTMRPQGRQAFATAHEMGHWHFGHGSRIDESRDAFSYGEREPEEWLADRFAAYLLMTSWAVKSGFDRRNIQLDHCTAQQIYTVACELGVGYGTLVQHMYWSLELITDSHAKQLIRSNPKSIRTELLPEMETKHLSVIDYSWLPGNIDAQTGNILMLPRGVKLEGTGLSLANESESGKFFRANSTGICRAYIPNTDWAKFIRISKEGFEGRSIYRHLEDPDAN